KGSPRMWALKEGSEIEAPELQLLDVKGAQQATAVGEGHIRMLDKAKGTRPIEARWTEKLIYVKEGTQDVLTLRGDATSLDPSNKHQLQADLLKVWLEPPGAAGPVAGDQARRKPHHIDALGHVTTSSSEMRIHDTERLVIWFKDAPPARGPLPAVLPPSEPLAAKPPAKPAGNPASAPPAPN